MQLASNPDRFGFVVVRKIKLPLRFNVTYPTKLPSDPIKFTVVKVRLMFLGTYNEGV